MWKIMWLLSGVLIVAACSSNTVAKQGEEQTKVVNESTVKSVLRENELENVEDDAGADECLSRGGKWIVMYQDGSKGCDLGYGDAGKACSDNAQCASNACLTKAKFTDVSGNVTGQCAASTNQKLNSCMNRVVNGRAVLQPCR